jgi:hypothetical protein
MKEGERVRLHASGEVRIRSSKIKFLHFKYILFLFSDLHKPHVKAFMRNYMRMMWAKN